MNSDSRQFWRFAAGNGHVTLLTERSGLPVDLLPPKLVTKGWSTLWRDKLNIAWLPAEQVFLRVLQLPECDGAELLSMVEFQLEKLSPMPVAQIVWSLEVIPRKKAAPDGLQTVVVFIVSRHVVEEYLGRLEHQGYLADRLELPFLHQLQATQIEADGIWVYPRAQDGKTYCLVAWWYGGVLQHLSLLHLSTPEHWAAELEDELKQIAWSGELEGWLTGPPAWHLVAEPEAGEQWQPVMTQLSGAPVEFIRPLANGEIAALSARRVARSETKVNLLPAEFSTRYRQQFIDRLWMKGLGAVFMLYIIGVIIYFGALQFYEFKRHQLNGQVTALKGDYERSQELQARIDVLKQQVGLRFAALDAWKAASEVLPSELTLTSFAFSRGKTLRLTGTVPTGEGLKVTDYSEALNRMTVDGTPIFENVQAPNISPPVGPGGNSTWSFSAELAGTGIK